SSGTTTSTGGTSSGLIGSTGGASSSGGIVAPGVPEPGVWAMMIIGFGMVGGALRRRGRAARRAVTAG
ncbi:MAG: PEPxxWA-CTERM sorting domain-containing protein, partial [Sphingopyxis sp.]